MLKKLLNSSEELTYQRINSAIIGGEAHIFSKIRIADVFELTPNNIARDLFDFALKAHFDFVISREDSIPLFAVEFDGPTHKDLTQKERDRKKDKICELLDFPILRINSKYLEQKYRGIDLLTYFVHAWFIGEAYHKEQEKGNIPWDDPFEPAFVFNIPGIENDFPLWLSLDVNNAIHKLFEQGKVADWGPSNVTAHDENGAYHSISWIRIDKQHGICAETGMKRQLFPYVDSSVLCDIGSRELHEKLLLTLDGKVNPIPIAQLDNAVKEFQKKYQMLSSSFFSR